MAAPRSVLALLSAAAAAAAGPVLSCGDSLCFSGHFNDNAVMQRAPNKAAYYGSVPTGSPAGVAVSLTLAAADGSYSKQFTTNAMGDGTWKVVLDPMPTGGNYSASISCPQCSGSNNGDTLYNQTFGDVYHCTGQSNSWLPLWFTFERNNSIAAIAAGQYANIKMLFNGNDPTNVTGNFIVNGRGPRGTCLGKGRGPNAWCSGMDLVFTWMRQELNETQFEEAPATCWYFAQYLTDQFIKNGETPPPLGIISTPEGGTMVEQWSAYSAQTQCVNATCLCTAQCNQSQPLNPTCDLNGGLYNANVEPLINTTIKGHIWCTYLSEHSIVPPRFPHPS